MSLNQQTCIPCKGGVPPLNETEAKTFLNETPGWKLVENASQLNRNVEFKNFKTALEFVNKVGELAESENHHPDISFGWGYVNITVYTHKIGGLHQNDFILAAKINSLI